MEIRDIAKNIVDEILDDETVTKMEMAGIIDQVLGYKISTVVDAELILEDLISEYCKQFIVTDSNGNTLEFEIVEGVIEIQDGIFLSEEDLKGGNRTDVE